MTRNILWHHGTCDSCYKKIAWIAHYGYDRQGKIPREDFRLCAVCLKIGMDKTGDDNL